jgi:hypothetical protein
MRPPSQDPTRPALTRPALTRHHRDRHHRTRHHRDRHHRDRPHRDRPQRTVCPQHTCHRCARTGEPANLSHTYEGPYELALGWFFAMPRSLVAVLASCRYAASFHDRAVSATREPFLRKEDDPLNGFWLYKCLRETHGATHFRRATPEPRPGRPLPSYTSRAWYLT